MIKALNTLPGTGRRIGDSKRKAGSLMKRIKRLAGWLILIGTGVLLGCGYRPQVIKNEALPEYVFTYAENQPEGYPTTLAAERFADLVYARTGGRIKIKIHAGGVLGDEVSVIEQLQYGGIDFARASIMTMGQFDPKMNVLQLPYLYQDADHMWAVLDGEIGAEFMAGLEEYDLKALSWYDAGARQIYTNEPIASLADLKGKRIRVAESDLMKSVISAFGGIPVPIGYLDVFSALETGEISGAENNWPSYIFTNHYKVAQYVYLDEHNRIPELQLVSQATWDQLSESDRQIIRSCARESAEYERTLWAMQERDSRVLAERSGVIVTEMTDAERQRFQAAVGVIYEEYGEEYREVIDKIISLGGTDDLSGY